MYREQGQWVLFVMLIGYLDISIAILKLLQFYTISVVQNIFNSPWVQVVHVDQVLQGAQ